MSGSNSFTNPDVKKKVEYRFTCVLKPEFRHKQTGNATSSRGEPIAIYYGKPSKRDKGLMRLKKLAEKMKPEFKIAWINKTGIKAPMETYYGN